MFASTLCPIAKSDEMNGKAKIASIKLDRSLRNGLIEALRQENSNCPELPPSRSYFLRAWTGLVIELKRQEIDPPTHDTVRMPTARSTVPQSKSLCKPVGPDPGAQ